MTTIEIINESTVVKDADAAAWTKALQIQVSRDFYPLWGANAILRFVPHGQKPSRKTWWMALLDASDQAGALGYHDVTNSGRPLGKVFAKTTLQYNDAVSVVLSHEILEMLGDPQINQVVQGTYQGRPVNWVKEACDAVENDGFGYTIDGVLVSDFVTLHYFDESAGKPPFDFKNYLTAPVPALTTGGYMSYQDANGWHQILGDQASLTAVAVYKARPLMDRVDRVVLLGITNLCAVSSLAYRCFRSESPALKEQTCG